MINMEVKEVKEKKKELVNRIEHLVRKFETDTETQIVLLDLERKYTVGKPSTLDHVGIKVFV